MDVNVDSDRTICGWRVRSALPLPELASWDGDDREPDIEIQLASVPAELPGAVHRGPFLQIAANGTCQFEVAAVARYLITAGRTIIVDQRPRGDAAAVRLFLLGTVFALLCHQRMVLPIHASCVSIDGTAVAFAGDTMAGKSVLAAMLIREGHTLLADDVCVVDWRDDGAAVVLSGAPRLLLWRQALLELNVAFEPGVRARAELEKYVVAVPGNPGPLPLGAVYELEIGRPPSPPVPISDVSRPRDAHSILHCALLGQQLRSARAVQDHVARLTAAAPRYSLAMGGSVRDAAAAAQFVIRHRALPA